MAAARRGCCVNAERLAYLVSRSLIAEHEVRSVTRSAHTVYRDRIALSVVDVDGDRWRLYVLREPWSAPS